MTTFDEACQWCSDNLNALHAAAIQWTPGALDLLSAYLAVRKGDSDAFTNRYFIRKYLEYREARHV